MYLDKVIIYYLNEMKVKLFNFKIVYVLDKYIFLLYYMFFVSYYIIRFII